MKKYFTKEDILILYKHMKSGSTSLAVRKTEIKTTSETLHTDQNG